jgi:hypothetical protein
VIGALNVYAIPATDPVKDGVRDLPSGIELQQLSISGTVTDASTGVLRPGVNVVVKGTSVGALTEINGKYSLTVPDQNAVLVF